MDLSGKSLTLHVIHDAWIQCPRLLERKNLGRFISTAENLL